MKISKAYKAGHYDAVEKEREKYNLALFDLMNGKFSYPLTLLEKDYASDEKGKLTMRLSWRGMPLFLVEWSIPGNEYKSITVYTEQELEDISREALGGSFTNQMLRDLFYKVKRAFYPGGKGNVDAG